MAMRGCGVAYKGFTMTGGGGRRLPDDLQLVHSGDVALPAVEDRHLFDWSVSDTHWLFTF